MLGNGCFRTMCCAHGAVCAEVDLANDGKVETVLRSLTHIDVGWILESLRCFQGDEGPNETARLTLSGEVSRGGGAVGVSINVLLPPVEFGRRAPRFFAWQAGESSAARH